MDDRCMWWCMFQEWVPHWVDAEAVWTNKLRLRQHNPLRQPQHPTPLTHHPHPCPAAGQPAVPGGQSPYPLIWVIITMTLHHFQGVLNTHLFKLAFYSWTQLLFKVVTRLDCFMSNYYLVSMLSFYYLIFVVLFIFFNDNLIGRLLPLYLLSMILQCYFCALNCLWTG